MIDWDMAAGLFLLSLLILVLSILPKEDRSKLTPKERSERDFDDWVDRNSW